MDMDANGCLHNICSEFGIEWKSLVVLLQASAGSPHTAAYSEYVLI